MCAFANPNDFAHLSQLKTKTRLSALHTLPLNLEPKPERYCFSQFYDQRRFQGCHLNLTLKSLSHADSNRLILWKLFSEDFGVASVLSCIVA